jgi:ADP-ribose pyrophosphatase
MIEKTQSSHTIYTGRVLNLRVDTVAGPQGVTTREIVEHAPAVTILPYDSAATIYLIHQFRKAVDEVLIEAPAGCIDPGESPIDAAHRELKEETGFVAEKCTLMGEMYMAPGFCNEYMHIFLATDLTAGPTAFDDDETMTMAPYSLTEVRAMITNGRIKDAKTVIAIQYLTAHLTTQQ